MKYDKSIFAHNAKAIRLLTGKSQTELGNILDIPFKTIGAVEEQRSATPEILLKYSEYAGTDINDLLTNKMKLPKMKRAAKRKASTNN